MKKCTLCVDRIYNEELAEQDRKPACVLACPTTARLFGDFSDPHSEVSILSKERDGVALMESLDYKPVNRYLPARKKRFLDSYESTNEQFSSGSRIRSGDTVLDNFFSWLDNKLS